MATRLGRFEMPKQVVKDEAASTDNYGKFYFAGVIVFTGLTAYDTAKLKSLGAHAGTGEAYTKLALQGALILYLDFINLFLMLLRLFGNRRD